MEIFRKLHSILAPSSEPAVRSQPRQPRPGSSGQPNFAETLRAAAADDPSILPFGVQNDRLADRLRGGPGIDSGSNETDRTTEPGIGGPAVLPEAPEVALPTDHPIDTLHIEMRDTLESLVILERERAGLAEPVLPPEVLVDPVTPEAGTGPSAAEPKPTKSATATPTVTVQLPPIGVRWQDAFLKVTGTRADGVDGTAAGQSEQIRIKLAHYRDPEGQGVRLNMEGRLFQDAVSKGYVTNDEAGLTTLLGQLNRAAMGPDARPPEITEYFARFFANERATSRT